MNICCFVTVVAFLCHFGTAIEENKATKDHGDKKNVFFFTEHIVKNCNNKKMPTFILSFGETFISQTSQKFHVCTGRIRPKAAVLWTTKKREARLPEFLVYT